MGCHRENRSLRASIFLTAKKALYLFLCSLVFFFNCFLVPKYSLHFFYVFTAVETPLEACEGATLLILFVFALRARSFSENLGIKVTQKMSLGSTAVATRFFDMPMQLSRVFSSRETAVERYGVLFVCTHANSQYDGKKSFVLGDVCACVLQKKTRNGAFIFFSFFLFCCGPPQQQQKKLAFLIFSSVRLPLHAVYLI